MRQHSFRLFSEKEKNRRLVRRSLLRNPSAVRADRVVRPYKKSVVVRIAGDSERREQSETLFRMVGMDGTDGGRPGFSGEILGLRSALCPLSFLGRLNPFFSFWQRKKRTGSKRRFFGRGGNRKKRADRVVRPYGCGGRYAVAPMHRNCSQTLRRHLPRRGRQSAAAGIWADEDRGDERIEMSAPTRDGVGVWFCFGKWDIEWWGRGEGA